MAKITKAMDYGYRKVIDVVLNPEAPHWVHTGDTIHPPEMVGNCPNSMVCTNNWKLREFIWTGEELFYEKEEVKNEKVVRVRTYKTEEMLKAEVMSMLRADISSQPTRAMAGLVGGAV